jgi:hypothetical protein
VQTPHPPLVFGGETDVARRRAAALGDGWYGVGHTPPSAGAQVAKLRAFLAAAGRAAAPFEVTVSHAGAARVEISSSATLSARGEGLADGRVGRLRCQRRVEEQRRMRRQEGEGRKRVEPCPPIVDPPARSGGGRCRPGRGTATGGPAPHRVSGTQGGVRRPAARPRRPVRTCRRVRPRAPIQARPHGARRGPGSPRSRRPGSSACAAEPSTTPRGSSRSAISGRSHDRIGNRTCSAT